MENFIQTSDKKIYFNIKKNFIQLYNKIIHLKSLFKTIFKKSLLEKFFNILRKNFFDIKSRRDLSMKVRSAIDRARRDLSGIIIGFVGTNSGMNRHSFYWFLNSNLGFST